VTRNECVGVAQAASPAATDAQQRSGRASSIEGVGPAGTESVGEAATIAFAVAARGVRAQDLAPPAAHGAPL
jgi:hypothetical protein